MCAIIILGLIFADFGQSFSLFVDENPQKKMSSISILLCQEFSSMKSYFTLAMISYLVAG